ncbi:hypothetical protein [Candidatus Phytoplasma tritici]|uniref:hypothetical protein n=1 Tax=Candidatus Phytoplasma tritici TaxID=321961 RepID=UPI0004296257|nr:hypothetical protein [Candidatus Phytoplasma tritici]
MLTDTVNKKTNHLVYVLSLLSLFFAFNIINSNVVWGDKSPKEEAAEKASDQSDTTVTPNPNENAGNENQDQTTPAEEAAEKASDQSDTTVTPNPNENAGNENQDQTTPAPTPEQLEAKKANVKAAFKELTQELLEKKVGKKFNTADKDFVLSQFLAKDKTALTNQLELIPSFKTAVDELDATVTKEEVKQKLNEVLEQNAVQTTVETFLDSLFDETFYQNLFNAKADLFVQDTDKEAIVQKFQQTFLTDNNKMLTIPLGEVVKVLLQAEVDKLGLTSTEKTQVEVQLTETLNKGKFTETLKQTAQTAKEKVQNNNKVKVETTKPTQITTEEKETKGATTKEVLVYVCLVLLVFFSAVGTFLYVKKQNK